MHEYAETSCLRRLALQHSRARGRTAMLQRIRRCGRRNRAGTGVSLDCEAGRWRTGSIPLWQQQHWACGRPSTACRSLGVGGASDISGKAPAQGACLPARLSPRRPGTLLPAHCAMHRPFMRVCNVNCTSSYSSGCVGWWPELSSVSKQLKVTPRHPRTQHTQNRRADSVKTPPWRRAKKEYLFHAASWSGGIDVMAHVVVQQ